MKRLTAQITLYFWRSLAVLSIYCLSVATLFAQSLDSLERLLEQKDLSDQDRIKIYDDLNWYYTNIDTDRSIEFGKQGLVLALNNKDDKMIGTFYKNIGIAYFMASVLDSAVIYLEKAQPYAERLQHYRMQASIYNTYGNIYRVQSLYDLTLENYFKAVSQLEKYNDLNGLCQVYSNIGGIYQIMKNFEQALKYLKIAEQLAIETDNQEGLASIYISFSDIGLYNGIPKEESISYAHKATEIYKKTNNRFAENKALQTLAKAYYHHDDNITAEPLARLAIKKAKELEFPGLTAEALVLLSSIHLDNQKYKESVSVALEVLNTDSTNTNITMSAYANLSRGHAHLGNAELSSLYLDKYREVLDRYANETYQNSLSGMEALFETEKKALKIESLEKQRQLYLWLGIVGAALLLIALAFAFIRYRLAVSHRKLAEKETQRLVQEKQLVAVQATLDGEAAERSRLAKDLHDGLGSMLSVVKFNLPDMKGGAVLETIDVSRFQKALGMLDESIQELRRVAHHMMPESLLRYGLKTSLSDFCDAIPMVDFHYFGEEKRLSEKLEILIYRCIHELVNNALKHAQATHINVQLVQESDRISFTVQDDGIGFDQNTVTEGMGLRNLRQRVAAFQGEVSIYSSNEGTEINVELYLKDDNNHDKSSHS